MASSSSSLKNLASFESSDESLMSVLELTRKPLLSVPNQYIRGDREPSIDLHNNSLNNINYSPEIPTINFNNLVMEESLELELEKLHLACKDWGIFQLVNHGVNPLLLEKLKNEVEEFFKLPLEEKKKYKIKPGDVEGYGSVIRTEDQKLDWGDRVFMTTNPISRRKPHLLPQFPSSLRTTLESYLAELNKIGMKLLWLLLEKCLKIEKKEEMVKEMFEDGFQAMRLTCYPRCPQPELVIGLSPHSDTTVVTILNQLNYGVNGLEIKKDHFWIPVNFLPDAFVVNVGDVLEIMSNGVYKSIEHRVMANLTRERISVATFFNPKLESNIGPIVSLINPQNPPLFKTIGVEKYISDIFASRKLAGKSFLEQMKII